MHQRTPQHWVFQRSLSEVATVIRIENGFLVSTLQVDAPVVFASDLMGVVKALAAQTPQREFDF